MAAQEYYSSFQNQGAPPPYPSTPQPPQGGRRPSLAPVQSPYSHNYSPAQNNHAPQQYLGVPGQAPGNAQLWRPQSDFSYPPPVPYQGSPNLQPQYGSALIPARSKSEPPENRRTSVDSYGSHKHHHHHQRDHSSSRSRSKSRSRHHDRDYDDRDYSDSSRSRSRHHSHHRKNSHETRDTFIGAGAGGLIGDALFPGLGTIFGALAGGAGGHEYSHRKDDRRRRESRSNSDSAYRDGITVKSGWIRR